MTAVEIIDEIKHLAPGDQAQVISFVRGLEQTSSRLTGAELTTLANELAGTTQPAEAEALKQRITAGFYGEETDA